MELFVVVGPTGVGKSKFAIELAKKYDGEIINGDSVQIYKEMDIGSAKLTKEEMENIPHHLIDIKDYREDYTIYDFQKDARRAIEDIKSRGKTPIICGGSGLYINAVIYDYTFETYVDNTYREQLMQRDSKELFDELVEIDPEESKKHHPNNKQRLVSTLTMIKSSKNTKTNKIAQQSKDIIYPAKIYFLNRNREELYKVINERAKKMFDDGLIEEAKKFDFNYQSQKAIGYKEAHDYINGTINLDEAIIETQKRSRNYAKKQISWFKNKIKCEEVYVE